MSNILTVAYCVEGPTDVRFLENVIQRTFEEIAFSCEGDIEVYQAIQIASPKLGNFVDNVLEIAKKAFNMGIHVICIHTDADSESDRNAMVYKITPAFEAITSSQQNVCKNLVAVIPIRMSEAWMLADTDLLKEEIGTRKNNVELGIARHPESIADPKAVIEEAIRIAQNDMPKKSRNLTLNNIYQPIGQKISLNSLDMLQSYQKFKISVKEAFRYLNYLH